MKRAPLGTAMTDPLTAVLERTPPMTSSGRCWTVQLLHDEPPMVLQVPIFVPFLVAAQERVVQLLDDLADRLADEAAMDAALFQLEDTL